MESQMSGKRSRDKGKRGELQWRNMLRALFGCRDARRGQQFAGGPGSPDVVDGIPGTHCEVKHTERLRLEQAMRQAVNDAGDDLTPYVAHRRSRDVWLVTCRATDLPALATKVYLHMASE